MESRSEKPPPLRPRWLCGLIAVAHIPLGLATRSMDALPDWIASHAGDALWAGMVFWLAATLFPRAQTGTLAAMALGFSFAVEFSQRMDHPVLHTLRSHRLGALILGRGFLPIDLVRYAGGIGCAVLLDLAIVGKGKLPVRRS